MNEDVIIVGASGHGKVIADIVLRNGDNVFGFLDDGRNGRVLGYPIIGKTELCERYLDKKFIIAIGNNYIRKKIAEQYRGLKYYTAIHPTAAIAVDIQIGEGSCVMANAVINASAEIGKHCIINSSAVVEHDNLIDDYVHISPHATLLGTVHVGEMSHIGGGAVIRNNIVITAGTNIGAGAVVVKNIVSPGTYIGVPAMELA